MNMNPEEHIDLVSAPYEGERVEKTVDGSTDSVNLENLENAPELQLLQKELEETKDRALRARAELENYRARIHRQVEQERKYASMDLFRDLLPVWDNLGRAIQSAEKNPNNDMNSLLQGVRLVYDQFLDVLQKHHCEKTEAINQPFDPNFHESIAMLPNADVPPNTVIEETSTGFRLFDRVVRPSQVVLAAKPS